MWLYIILGIVSYLLGSISSAVWIGKRFYGIDIREHGSGNAGATNMLRVLGKKSAIPVFLIDFVKGFIAVSIALFTELEGNELFILKLSLALLAVVGHMYPLYSNFKGGKGVATTAGAMLAVVPIALLFSLAVFVLILIITKYVSLSSMIAGISFPSFIYITEGELSIKFYFGILVAILLIYTHHKNITRLLKGTESKINFKNKKNTL